MSGIDFYLLIDNNFRVKICLFVELHHEGSAPAACAVGFFSLYSDKTYLCGIFFKAGSQKIQNIRIIGLSKKNNALFCVCLFWQILQNLLIYNWDQGNIADLLQVLHISQHFYWTFLNFSLSLVITWLVSLTYPQSILQENRNIGFKF